MKANVDGVPWAAATVSRGISGGFLNLAGANALPSTLVVNAPAQVGTWTVALNSRAEATLTTAAGSWEASSFPTVIGSGMVTIITLTATGATGTFSFTLTATAGSSGTRSITGGVFDVTF